MPLNVHETTIGCSSWSWVKVNSKQGDLSATALAIQQETLFLHCNVLINIVQWYTSLGFVWCGPKMWLEFGRSTTLCHLTLPAQIRHCTAQINIKVSAESVCTMIFTIAMYILWNNYFKSCCGNSVKYWVLFILCVTKYWFFFKIQSQNLCWTVGHRLDCIILKTVEAIEFSKVGFWFTKVQLRIEESKLTFQNTES